MPLFYHLFMKALECHQLNVWHVACPLSHLIGTPRQKQLVILVSWLIHTMFRTLPTRWLRLMRTILYKHSHSVPWKDQKIIHGKCIPLKYLSCMKTMQNLRVVGILKSNMNWLPIEHYLLSACYSLMKKERCLFSPYYDLTIQKLYSGHQNMV